MNWCKKCGDYNFGDHKCPPKWILWQPDAGEEGPDDGREVYGHSGSEAVEAWAARDDSDSADYTIVGGQPATVWLQHADGSRCKYIVVGETIAHYSARVAE